MLSPAMHRPGWETAVVKTVASQRQGLDELFIEVGKFLAHGKDGRRNHRLLAERAYYLIRERRMKDVDMGELEEAIARACEGGMFNLYQFVAGRG